MKIYLAILFFLVCGNTYAQTDTALQRMIDAAKVSQQKKDTAPRKAPALNKNKDSGRKKNDTIFLHDTAARKAIVPVRTDSTQLLLPDSLLQMQADSTRQIRQPGITLKDTGASASIPWLKDTAFARLLHLPGLVQASQLTVHEGTRRAAPSRDYLFYFFIGLFLYLGIVKQAFPGYLQNLFRILFQRMQRYKQSREMMTQYAVPSLLLNIFFFILAGFFITIQLEHVPVFHFDFTQKIVAAIAAVAALYALKAIVISLAGHIFHVRDAALAYAQIVFHTNKVAAILSLPLILIYVYTPGESQMKVVSFIYALVFLLWLYRYIIAFIDVSGRWRVNAIYFFVYLCLTEIIPSLIIYNVFLNIVSKYTISG